MDMQSLMRRFSSLKLIKVIIFLSFFVLVFLLRSKIFYYSFLLNDLSIKSNLLMVAPQSEQQNQLEKVAAIFSNINSFGSLKEQQVIRLQGYFFHRSNKPQEALQLWDEVGFSPSLFLWHSDQAKLQKNFDESLIWLSYGSSLYPKLSVFPYRIGLINDNLDEWAPAIEAYEKAIKLATFQDMSQSHLYYRLAINYHRRKGYQDLEKAFEAYDKAISINDFTSPMDLADAYYGRGDISKTFNISVEESVQDFENAIYYNPDHEWAHLMIGKEIQDYDATNAEEHFLLALENWENENNLQIPLLALGEFYCREGDFENGIVTYEKVYDILSKSMTDAEIEKSCMEFHTK